MGKKIIVSLLSIFLFLGCKKEKNCPDEYAEFSLPDVWFDSLQNKTTYKYYYRTKDSLTDVIEAYKYEKYISIVKLDCGGYRNDKSYRTVFRSENYNYLFEFHIDDTNDDNIGETQVDYYDNITYRWDLFTYSIEDSTQNKVRLYRLRNNEISSSGHCSFLSSYTNSAGITFNNVLKFTTLSSKQSFAKPASIKEFYATTQLGIIEYTTNGGISFSYLRREEL